MCGFGIKQLKAQTTFGSFEKESVLYSFSFAKPNSLLPVR